jgi:hypothetical protein
MIGNSENGQNGKEHNKMTETPGTYTYSTPTNIIHTTDLWLGFSSDYTDEKVIAIFVKRYGQRPQTVLHVPNNVLVGPVPRKDHVKKQA